jgi:hypothetical protein
MGGRDSMTPTSANAPDGRIKIAGDEYCVGNCEQKPSAERTDAGNDKTTSTADPTVAHSAPDVRASWEKARIDGRMNAMGGALRYGHSN